MSAINLIRVGHLAGVLRPDADDQREGQGQRGTDSCQYCLELMTVSASSDPDLAYLLVSSSEPGSQKSYLDLKCQTYFFLHLKYEDDVSYTQQQSLSRVLGSLTAS